MVLFTGIVCGNEYIYILQCIPLITCILWALSLKKFLRGRVELIPLKTSDVLVVWI